MLYSKLKKAKILVSSIAMLAASTLAGEGNINYYGQLGVHKTQSAQTLGHGRFGLGFFAEGAGIGVIIKDDRFNGDKEVCGDDNCLYSINNYIGVNGYPFLSLGLSDYFDFSVSIPVYLDYLKANYAEAEDLTAGGQGNLFISSKIRAPFDNEFPVDFAFLFGFGISTGKTNLGGINDYGPWVRDPMFLNIKEDYPIQAGIGNGASTYTNANAFMKFGAAITLDFGRMKAAFPLLFHLNYAYRMPLGQGGEFYPAVQNFSTALELTPVEFISIFGEFYTDMPTKWPTNGSKTDLSTVSLGTSFHLSEKVDLQIGVQIFVGDENKYIDSLAINLAGEEKGFYSARLIPKYMAFGGLTVKLFVIEEEEEEEYRNPDTDGDGVCDPWVTETGRQREFARVCKGIDLCPYEPGPKENKGCPINEAEPIVLFTASPDVVEKGQSVTLSWQTTNATEVTIEGIGTVSESGSKKVKPTENTTYTITAIGEGGSKTVSIEVEVASGPIPNIIFTTSPDIVQKGGTVTLNWQVSNATEVSIDGDIGTVKANGSKKVKPTESTTYTLTATGAGGTQTATVEVEIAAGPVPVVMFSANPETVQVGHTAKLSWQVTNATEISIDNGVGVVQAKGTKQVKPEQSTVYTLTATGEGGTVTETVEIDVTEPPPIEAKVNLKGVNFVSGKAELTLNAKQVLDGVAEQLLEPANAKVKIEIHGHTDNVGNQKANQELSEKRAKAVVGYLATKGVKMSRMNAVGFGSDVPIGDNKTADGRELNRRIEMIRVDN